jgi:ABC-type lipoprotein export system ATPase subunit/GNAT superfamily N-acetyltransferase
MSEIKLINKIPQDIYTDYVCGSFDISKEKHGEVVIKYNLSSINTFDWNVGIIIGGSGSGKTSLLKNIGSVSTPIFDDNLPLISNFNWLTPKEATFLLTSMGLSSVPTWLRPYRLLSNGEQHRASMAYAVSSAKDGEMILIDEFTSVVDRDVAKAISYSMQKYIRRLNKKVLIASCHYDILEWLMPDWICNLQNGGRLEKADYLRQGRPKISLSVSRTTYETWNIFKKHHYLTELNNQAFSHYLFEWNNKPVGIVVVSPMPSGTLKNAYRGSRTVVLPDYQGLGIGSKISDFIASIYKKDGKKYYTKTINPALGEYRNNSKNWRSTPDNGKIRKKRNKTANYDSHWKSKTRPSYCHEYIGSPISGYENLLLPMEEMKDSYINSVAEQLTLF